jgi:hypothetical protein
MQGMEVIMKKVIWMAAVTAALTSPAWSKSHSKPEWVDNASTEFPRDKYLTGVGSADDRATAEDRARGEISKIFSSQITVKSDSNISESTQQQTGKKDQHSFSQSVAQSVQNVSKKVLEGVEVHETWQDEASRVWYALAILDKDKSISAVTEKITDFDGQIKQWYAQMSQASDKLPRVKAAMKLVALFKARKEIESDLQVLDGKGIPCPVDEASVSATASKTLSELEVVVDIK